MGGHGPNFHHRTAFAHACRRRRGAVRGDRSDRGRHRREGVEAGPPLGAEDPADGGSCGAAIDPCRGARHRGRAFAGASGAGKAQKLQPIRKAEGKANKPKRKRGLLFSLFDRLRRRIGAFPPAQERRRSSRASIAHVSIPGFPGSSGNEPRRRRPLPSRRRRSTTAPSVRSVWAAVSWPPWRCARRHPAPREAACALAGTPQGRSPA